MEAAPLQGATYSIEALPAPREVAEMLAIDARQSCLVLKRRTTSHGPGGVGGDDVASGRAVPVHRQRRLSPQPAPAARRGSACTKLNISYKPTPLFGKIGYYFV